VGYHLIPRDVAASAASFGVIGVGVAGTDHVTLHIDGAELPVAEWQTTRGVRHRELRVGGLAAATPYSVELRADGALAARCRLVTLPNPLPPPGAKPFTIFLGSCFCRAQDASGSVEKAYRDLPPGAVPDVHVWCGDQVYLDSPWHGFLLPHAADDLEAMFLRNYDLTWGGHGSGSLHGALTSAANYFTSDDHEFWNNAPNRGVYVSNSWTADGRAEWLELAADLYRVFQTESRISELRVGNLSLLVADTRIDRDADERRFMTDADLGRVCDWIRDLDGPGLLVLGQPAFTEPAGLMGHVADWGLPDYDAQYARLAGAIAASQHSVVVLTGDVHFGRIAVCALRSGAELIEIISSPLALVDPAVRGKWRKAPQTFPSTPVAGVAQSPVTTLPYETNDPHFVTLELHALGQAAELTVRHWPVGPTTRPRGATVFTRRLR
jgi:hypothetical protein